MLCVIDKDSELVRKVAEEFNVKYKLIPPNPKAFHSLLMSLGECSIIAFPWIVFDPLANFVIKLICESPEAPIIISPYNWGKKCFSPSSIGGNAENGKIKKESLSEQIIKLAFAIASP